VVDGQLRSSESATVELRGGSCATVAATTAKVVAATRATIEETITYKATTVAIGVEANSSAGFTVTNADCLAAFTIITIITVTTVAITVVATPDRFVTSIAVTTIAGFTNDIAREILDNTNSSSRQFLVTEYFPIRTKTTSYHLCSVQLNASLTRVLESKYYS
jgi:hypothetical protein